MDSVQDLSESVCRKELEKPTLSPQEVLEKKTAAVAAGRLLRAWAHVETGAFDEARQLLDEMEVPNHPVERKCFDDLNQAVGIWHQLSHGVDSDHYGHWLNANNVPGRAYLVRLCRKRSSL
jgi:hypothetical protein